MHGVVNFGIPNLELGAQMRTTLNISASLKGKAEYDRKTKKFKSETDAPETSREVLTLKRNAYHYLKYVGMQMEVKSDGHNLRNDQVSVGLKYIYEYIFHNLLKPLNVHALKFFCCFPLIG